jgi:CheY-like chemotaxis protein
MLRLSLLSFTVEILPMEALVPKSGKILVTDRWEFVSISPVSVPTLLHVEDEDGSAFLFRHAVREAGFSVVVFRVSNGEEALAFLRKSGPYAHAERPKLMVLDLNLPKIDGLSVLTRLRSDESLRSIPVVVISTSSRPADKEKAFLLGASHYIVKPDSFEKLTEQVKAACAGFFAT